MNKPIEYCVGFYFFKGMDKVLLIRKNRPEWQRGLLNGIGGKIEKEETYREGMLREFQEETHMQTSVKDWHEVCILTFPKATIYIFTAESKSIAPDMWLSPTDEPLEIFNTIELQNRNDIIPNLRCLIPLALDRLKVRE